MADKRGGLLLRVDGELRFVPSSVAVRVVALPPVTRVPGGPASLLGIALHEGAVIPVVALGPTRGAMVVCEHEGELLGLVGAEVLGAEGHDGEVPVLDLAGIYARLRR